jgi:hypothetical protein
MYPKYMLCYNVGYIRDKGVIMTRLEERVDNLQKQLYEALEAINNLDARLKLLEPEPGYWERTIEDSVPVKYKTAVVRLRRTLEKANMKIMGIRGGKKGRVLFIHDWEKYSLASDEEQIAMAKRGEVAYTTTFDLIDQFEILRVSEYLVE